VAIEVYDLGDESTEELYTQTYGTIEEFLRENWIDGGVERALCEAIEKGCAVELVATFEGDPPIKIRYTGEEIAER
jgi:hypothetical protein